MSIRWFENTARKIGTTQSPLSFEKDSLIDCPALAVDSLGVAKLAVISQMHGSEILEFSHHELINKCTNVVSFLGEADALILESSRSQLMPPSSLAVGIRTADCLPIVIETPTRIALLHAGWRGLAAGLVEKVIGRLLNHHCEQKEMRFYIAPSAKECCYEVGQEVLESLNLSRIENNKFQRIDLQILAAARVARNAPSASVEIDQRCTICSKNLHSFRRNRSSLRNLTFVLIE